MSVIVLTLIERAVGIPGKVTDGNGTEQTAWIVPTLFCATSCENDARYGVGDGTLTEN